MSKAALNSELNKIRLDTINKILVLYPELIVNKNHIIKQICKTTNIKITNDESLNEVILDQIIINGNTYYKDEFGNVIDENAQLVGVVQKVNNKNTVMKIELQNKKSDKDYIGKKEYKEYQKLVSNKF